jgi:hypothetical protein
LIILKARTIDSGDPPEWLLAALLYAIASSVLAVLVVLSSYVGLFQRIDRRQQLLRVAQLVLSLVLLVPGLSTIVLTFFLVGIDPG